MNQLLQSLVLLFMALMSFNFLQLLSEPSHFINVQTPRLPVMSKEMSLRLSLSCREVLSTGRCARSTRICIVQTRSWHNTRFFSPSVLFLPKEGLMNREIQSTVDAERFSLASFVLNYFESR